MTRKEGIVIASRALAVLFTGSVLAEITYLPEMLHEYLHYAHPLAVQTDHMDHLRHYYLLRLGFLITRIVGFSLLARWLYRGGPPIEELMFPQPQPGDEVQP
jgi:hypothetical protein